jgi:hypothetical protein
MQAEGREQQAHGAQQLVQLSLVGKIPSRDRH